MKRVVSNWFSKPLYPIMIAAYPVLALLSSNAGQIQPEAGIRSLLVSVVFGGVLFFVIWLFIRQAHKAAFLATLWLALFFTFGHAYIAIQEKYPDANYTTWLAVGWGVLFVLALVWATGRTAKRACFGRRSRSRAGRSGCAAESTGRLLFHSGFLWPQRWACSSLWI